MRYPLYFFGYAMVILLAASCSTYGWADSRTAHDSDHSLRVAPLHIPAQLDLDRGLLRTLLVDELELQGVTVDITGSAPILQCAMTGRDSTAFEHTVVAELRLACDIRPTSSGSPTHAFEVVGTAQDSIGSPASIPRAAIEGTRRADTSAATDAITRLAAQIASTLNATATQR